MRNGIQLSVQLGFISSYRLTSSGEESDLVDLHFGASPIKNADSLSMTIFMGLGALLL